MSVSFLRYCGRTVNLGVALGALTNVTPHQGFDRVPQVQLRFEHAVVEMPTAALWELIRQAQEVLAAGRNINGANYSGALADLGGDT